MTQLDNHIGILVEKRNGEVVPFSREKIKSAITQAAIAGHIVVQPEVYENIVEDIASEVSERFVDFHPNVENIHDLVEKYLMRNDLIEAARQYIVFRAERQREREEERKKVSFVRKLTVYKRDGRKVLFNPKKVVETVERAAEGLSGIDVGAIYDEAVKGVYDGIKSEEIEKALVLASTSFIETEPDYSYLAARLFSQRLKKEVFGISVNGNSEEVYRDFFINSIKIGVDNGLLDPRLGEFDLDALSEKLVIDRDKLFRYIGLQTLYQRYFVKHAGRSIELPQIFWMRVAMGLAINEENREEKAIEFYEVMSNMNYVPSTPTLFHSGLTHPQLSSCYLTTIDDDLKDIFKSYADNSQLSKWSGGIGNDWTNVRSLGSFINSTRVDSQGTVPFLKIANDTTFAINRSGKRRGATVAYLETWHLDIEDFLDMKKNTGDDRRRTHDMNTANWIPDLFMKRVRDGKDWTLFSPDETPDLHDLYGKSFEKAYVSYERKAKRGSIKKFKVVPAKKIWKKMLTMLFETGHPWLTFKDPCNVRSPQDHVGVVHSSNLCCVSGTELVPVLGKGLIRPEEMHEIGGDFVLAGKDEMVTAPMHRPVENGKLVKIRTKEGYSHTVTPDHKVWLANGEYREAKDLLFGDKLALQTVKGLWGKANLKDEAFIAGLWCGDGTKSKYSVYIDLWPQDYNLIPEIEATIARILEKYKDVIKCNTTSVSEPKFSVGDCKARLSSSPLKQVFSHLGFHQKIGAPDFVIRSSEDTVKSFLRGLYFADGTVEGCEVTTVSLCSTNYQLLEDLQIVWLNLGAKTSLTKMDEEGWRQLPDGKGGYKNYWCKAKYRLMHTSIKSSKIAETSTGIGVQRGNKVFLENIQKQGYVQKMWATFEGLEDAGEGPAYCPTVPTADHLWVCNGFLTKNTEITLNTEPSKLLSEDVDFEEGVMTRKYKLGQVAVCNLGSIVTPNHMNGKKLDRKKLAATIQTAMRMLDNVIDLNYYPIPEAKYSNLLHRPVGLGLMGMQDALCQADINYEESNEFVDEVMELISYNAILASSKLAAERGAYKTYQGSKWSRGIFPIDTIDLLAEERGEDIKIDRTRRLNWDKVYEHVAKFGMRNSNTMAIAPTATIATIVGTSPCTEPYFKNLYVKTNMSGEFTVVNEFLVKDLKKIKLWNKDMLDQIKYHNGSVQEIDVIPEEIRAKYKEAFEIDPVKMLELTALRGKWIDQSQSHNVFIRGTSGKALSDLYMYAWEIGLKTTYYMRSMGVSGIEKSTLDANKYGFTQRRGETNGKPHNGHANGEVKLCRLEDPTCEACQ